MYNLKRNKYKNKLKKKQQGKRKEIRKQNFQTSMLELYPLCNKRILISVTEAVSVLLVMWIFRNKCWKEYGEVIKEISDYSGVKMRYIMEINLMRNLYSGRSIIDYIGEYNDIGIYNGLDLRFIINEGVGFNREISNYRFFDKFHNSVTNTQKIYKVSNKDVVWRKDKYVTEYRIDAEEVYLELLKYARVWVTKVDDNSPEEILELALKIDRKFGGKPMQQQLL